jgi:hypothetical protein
MTVLEGVCIGMAGGAGNLRDHLKRAYITNSREKSF